MSDAAAWGKAEQRKTFKTRPLRRGAARAGGVDQERESESRSRFRFRRRAAMAEPGAPMRLKEWLIAQIDSGRYPGLRWENRHRTLFRIPWKHAAKQDYRQQEDAALFKVPRAPRGPHPALGASVGLAPGLRVHSRGSPLPWAPHCPAPCAPRNPCPSSVQPSSMCTLQGTLCAALGLGSVRTPGTQRPAPCTLPGLPAAQLCVLPWTPHQPAPRSPPGHTAPVSHCPLSPGEFMPRWTPLDSRAGGQVVAAPTAQSTLCPSGLGRLQGEVPRRDGQG